MVSLEEQMSYLQRVENTPKLSAFKNMLSGQSILCPNSNLQISDTEKIYYEIIIAIQTGDKDKFVEPGIGTFYRIIEALGLRVEIVKPVY
jgi:hypothetical protein